ncbi:MAG: AmmeMemoRadiSam system protein A [Anaerolineae bacterium]|nr:AmmeMemoRadiSam system protein A [Anaerolineae bacterium]
MEEETGKLLLAIARRSLNTYLVEQRQYEPDLKALPDALRRPGASFVTLYACDRLRGCVGSVEPYLPLALDVAQNAIAAAARDPRFRPVTCDELPMLHLSVTVLTPLQPLVYENESDLRHKLRPGIDGVLITWYSRRSVLLPQVWERLPDPETFLLALTEKAGIPCAELAAQPPTINVFTFAAESCEEDEYA